MKKGNVLFLIFFYLVCLTKASDYPLSSSSTISLLTCAKGERFFESYGHSAIRVKDTVNNADVVFNYGAFNSSENQFYLDFLMGKPTFYLVIVPTADFLKEYESENRAVTASYLNLSIAQRQRIFDYLLWNADQQNYAYQYDFVYNNCATKINDILIDQLSEDGIFSLPKIPVDEKYTLKEMLIQDIANHPLGSLGFYTILGVKLDKYPTTREWIFLPKNLKTALEKATLNGLPLVTKKNVIVRAFENKNNSGDYSIKLILIITSILPLATFLFRCKILNLFMSQAILFLLGSLGLFLTCMCVFTNNDSTYWNWNLLWANPLFFVLLIVAKLKNLSVYKLGVGLLGVLLFFIIVFYYLFTHHLSINYLLFLLTLGVYFSAFIFYDALPKSVKTSQKTKKKA